MNVGSPFRGRSSRGRIAGAIGALCLVPLAAAPDALAVSPKYWIQDTPADFLKGKLEGVSVTKEGTLQLAPDIETLAEPDAPYLWDVAVDAKGRAYLGTGDDGWVMRVAGKEPEGFFQCDALEVLSLAMGADGTLYAGTGPDGLLYRIHPDGKGDVLFDAPEAYIWDLAIGPDGALYAAVGPRAGVWRIDLKTGKAESYAQIDDNHVVSLAFDSQGRLLLGTEGRGLVVRVEKDRHPSVLFDCPEGEVGAVLGGADGVVWAAASSASEQREKITASKPDSSADGSGSPDSTAPDDESDKPDSTDGVPAPWLFRVRPPEVGKGVVYRIDAGGDVARFWESGQGAIFDLADAGHGEIYATTGDDGRVYRVLPDGGVTLLLDAKEDHVVAIVRDPTRDAWLLATANPSRLLRMSTDLRASGTYESQVLDADRLAKWGRIDWSGEAGGGAVTFAVRTGNTEKPDGTWSAWGKETSGASTALDVPKARYLQWRATMKGGGTKTPSVRRVRVSSLQDNVPPVIANLEVIPSGTRFYDEEPDARPRPLYQSLPGGVSVQYQLESGPSKFPPEQRAPWTQGLRQIRWEAGDPNGDTLLYELSFRRTDETEWKQFAKDVDATTWTFNSNGVPDGEYVVRVTATDKRANPYDPKTAERVSEPFLVDNTGPVFRNVVSKRDGGKVEITATLEDETSDVVRMEYSVDGGDWFDQPPVDGIFDSRSEGLDVKVDADAKKEHCVFLRGTDLAGNLGTTRVLVKP
ncbi:MAG: hypothetical protein U0167_17855 [bacterium]